MHMQFWPSLPTRGRLACKFSFAAAVCLGCLLGARIGNSAGEDVLSLMRAAICCRVSIVGLLVVMVLPFLFAAFAVSFSKPWLTIAVCTWKAFTFCFCVCCICRAFSSAGWLIRLLLMFSDGCLFPLLIWFCLRHLEARRSVRYDLAACAGLLVLVLGIDYCYVSPFLAMLIEI